MTSGGGREVRGEGERDLFQPAVTYHSPPPKAVKAGNPEVGTETEAMEDHCSIHPGTACPVVAPPTVG